MTVDEMHYAVKMQLNKIDSQQFRNLLVQEIDFLLNAATELFIKMTLRPRYNPIPGFEKTQRDIDDLRTLVAENVEILPTSQDNEVAIYPLPDDYTYFVSASVMMNNSECGKRKGKIHIRQHDDEFQLSPFDKSSYEWKEINAVFNNNGIMCYLPDNATLEEMFLTYIMEFPYIHNAQRASGGSYVNLRGETLTGHQDCILPEHTHSEVVDLAVLLASLNLQLPDVNFKLSKLKLT